MKYKYYKVLQGYYGTEWADLEDIETNSAGYISDIEDRQNWRILVSEYNNNEPYPHRVITRRSPDCDLLLDELNKLSDPQYVISGAYGGYQLQVKASNGGSGIKRSIGGFDTLPVLARRIQAMIAEL